MNKQEFFPPANLSDPLLKKLKAFEDELKQDSGENIILIAYEEKNEEIRSKE